MENLIKKHKNFFVLGSLLLLILIFIIFYFIIKINFQESIKGTLKNYAKLNVEFENIKLGGINKVILENFILKDESEKTLLIAEELELNFSLKNILLKKNKKIDILIKNAVINFEMYADYQNNFLNYFSKNKKSKNDSDKGIISQIIVKNSQLDFRDFGKEKPIYKRLENLNAKMIFLGKNFEMSATGEEKDEKYFFSLKNNEDLELNLNVNNVEINDKTMQYAFIDKNINYIGGLASFKFNMKDKKITVKGRVNDAELVYNDVKQNIKSINGNFEYKDEKLKMDFNGKVDEKDLKLNLAYTETGTEILINADEFYYLWLENYKLLELMKLDIKGKIDKGNLKINIKNNGAMELAIEAKSKRILFMGKLLNNVKMKLSFKDEKWKVENANFYLDDEFLKAKVKLNAEFEDQFIKGNCKLDEIDFYIKEKSVAGQYKFQFENQKLNLDLKSLNNNYLIDYDILENKVDLKTRFLEKIELNYENQKIILLGDFEASYLLNENYLKKTKFDLKIYDFYNIEKIAIEGKGENNQVEIEKLYLTEDNNYLYSDGNVNLEDLTYKFEIRQSQINIKKTFEKIGITTDFDITTYASGIITGKKDKYKALISLSSELGEYYIKYKNIKGNIKIINDQNFRIESDLKAKEISYKDFAFKDIETTLSFEDNILRIKKFGNNLLKITGEYDISSLKVNLDFILKDYFIKDLTVKTEKASIFIKKIEGSIVGTFDRLKVFCNAKELDLTYNKNKFVISGKTEYYENEIKFENIKLDSNMLNGKIDFLNKEFDLKLNILENNYKKLYNVRIASNEFVEKLNARVLGEVNIWGGFEDFKSTGKVNLDSIFYDGNKQPNLMLKYSYSKGSLYDLNKGILNFSNIKIFNDLKEDILSANGRYIFSNKEIDMIIDNEIIDISRLHEVTGERLKGLVKLDASLKGTYDKLKYKAKLSSNRIEILNYVLEDVNTEFQGGTENIVLKNLKLIYNGNPLNAKGELFLKPFNYNLKIEAQEVDLAGLGFLLKDKIKGLSGKARLNIIMSKENSQGLIALDNINFSDLNDNLIFKNISSRIDIEKDRLVLRYIKGDINKGYFILDGSLFFHEENDDFLKNRFFPDNWSFNYELRNLDYRMGKYINLLLDSKGILNEKELRGKLIIKKGEIRGFENTNNKEQNDFLKKLNVYLDVEIKKELKVAFEKISVIQEIESRLEGTGSLKIEDGKLNFLGTLSTDKGIVTFNNNDFEIETGVMVFENPYEFFPEINPSIALSAMTQIAGEEIYVKIYGDLKNPKADLSSAVKGSNGEKLNDTEIIALLAFHNKMDFSNTGGSTILEELLARQLKTQIFNPISSKLEKVLKIPKISISPNISIKDSTEENSSNSVIELGGKLELGDIPFFNKYLFLNFGMEYLDKNDQSNIYIYDAKLDYRFKENSSLFFKVNKTQEQENNETQNDVLKLGVGFEFIRRFNFFEDLIKER